MDLKVLSEGSEMIASAYDAGLQGGVGITGGGTISLWLRSVVLGISPK